jgi:hypothetical protein
LQAAPSPFNDPGACLVQVCSGSAYVDPPTSRELEPPSEQNRTPTAGNIRQLSWGLVLFSATEPGGFTPCGGSPAPPLRSAFRVSHPPDGFHPPRPTRPCFVPGALMRFSLRGLSPLTSRTPLEAVAPASLESDALPASRSRQFGRQTHRPRSIAPVREPHLGTLVLPRIPSRCPHGFLPL